MHASAPRPKRSREPSRAQSHRPRHRPHARHPHARHTHACDIHIHLMPIPLSLCHSPDLTEPPHATNTLHIYVRRPRCTHADSSRILCTRCPPRHPPTPPPGGTGEGPPSPLSARRERGRKPRTPSSRPGEMRLLGGGGRLLISVRSIAPDPQGWGRSVRRPAPPTPVRVVRTGSNPKARKP